MATVHIDLRTKFTGRRRKTSILSIRDAGYADVKPWYEALTDIPSKHRLQLIVFYAGLGTTSKNPCLAFFSKDEPGAPS